MNVHELPLVIFTILAQMSVGSFVVLGVIRLLAGRRAGDATIDALSDPALYAIGPVMVLALIASLFHLGDPFHAMYTIKNFGSSRLSQEIAFGVSFAVLGGAFAVTQKLRWLTPLLRQLLAGLTALVGLGLVFVMSMVYMLPSVPGWDSWATPVGFFTTTFLLGSLAIGAAFVAVTTVRRVGAGLSGDVTRLVRQSLQWISVAALVLLGVEFVVLPTYALSLATRDGVTAQSAHLLLLGGGSVFVLRLVLVFLGAGLIGLFLHRFASALGQRLTVFAAVGAFTLVLASEVLGRILFYSSYARIGL